MLKGQLPARGAGVGGWAQPCSGCGPHPGPDAERLDSLQRGLAAGDSVPPERAPGTTRSLETLRTLCSIIIMEKGGTVSRRGTPLLALKGG